MQPSPRPQGPALALCLWQVEHNVSLKELAAELGCSLKQVSRYRRGAAKPERAIAAVLERVTGGRVAVAMWDA